MKNIISSLEIMEFISRQPDNRPLDFDQSASWDSCGCVMVHYGKDVLNLGVFSCGMFSIGQEFELEDGVFSMLSLDGKDKISIENYGQLKQHLMSENS